MMNSRETFVHLGIRTQSREVLPLSANASKGLTDTKITTAAKKKKATCVILRNTLKTSHV
eukprot:jgi/Antlo1/1628/1839